DHEYRKSTIDKENTKTQEEAMVELYRRLRPGDPPTKENAESLINSLLFNPRRYDLARVGRYKLNQRLHSDIPLEQRIDKRILLREDLLKIVAHLIDLNNHEVAGNDPHPDDDDHLGTRRRP